MPNNNIFDPLDFGGADDNHLQAAVAAARAASGAVVLAPGITYQHTTPILLDWTGASIGGSVAGVRSTLMSMSATNDALQLAPSLEHQSIHDLILTRGVQVSGGAGINQLGNIDKATIHNVQIELQYLGICLSGTAFSRVSDLEVERCVSHGILLRPDASAVMAMQWYFSGQNLSTENGGSGLLVDTSNCNAPAGVCVGSIDGFATYGNLGYGVAFTGTPNAPIQSVRMHGGFLGEDQKGELLLDTYAGNHRISGLYGELSNGRGIYVTVNNNHVSLNDVAMHAHVLSGFCILSDDTCLTNCAAVTNGRTAPDGSVSLNPYGFYLGGHRASIVGGLSGNENGGQMQHYGVVNALPLNPDGSQERQILTGHNSAGNAVAGLLGTFAAS